MADARLIASRDSPYKIGFQPLPVAVADKAVSCERDRPCDVSLYHIILPCRMF